MMVGSPTEVIGRAVGSKRREKNELKVWFICYHHPSCAQNDLLGTGSNLLPRARQEVGHTF